MNHIFLEPTVQSMQRYLPGTGDANEPIVAIWAWCGNSQPRPSRRQPQIRVTPIVLYLALADISVYRYTESSEELLKKRRPTEVPVSPNRQPACANRQAKLQYPRWFVVRCSIPAAISIDLCTCVRERRGEPWPFGFVNRPIEERNIECRFSSVTTMSTRPSKY